MIFGLSLSTLAFWCFVLSAAASAGLVFGGGLVFCLAVSVSAAHERAVRAWRAWRGSSSMQNPPTETNRK